MLSLCEVAAAAGPASQIIHANVGGPLYLRRRLPGQPLWTPNPLRELLVEHLPRVQVRLLKLGAGPERKANIVLALLRIRQVAVARIECLRQKQEAADTVSILLELAGWSNSFLWRSGWSPAFTLLPPLARQSHVGAVRSARATLILSDPFQLLMLATDFGRAACDERCPAKA